MLFRAYIGKLDVPDPNAGLVLGLVHYDSAQSRGSSFDS
jgi:hypothetical protein